MKDLEQYIIATAKKRETSEQRRHRQRMEDRQRKQMQYNNEKMLYMAAGVCGVLILVAIFVSLSVKQKPAQAAEPEKLAVRVTETKLAPVEMPELNGDQEIEAALAELGYWRPDVPLDFEIQIDLRVACDTNDLPFELVLAQMWRETHYQNLIGDDGASVGYLQVQEKWHWDRMARLGVTDLKDSAGNFAVACDYLRECIDSTDTLADALTLYNSGHTGKNQYATEVLHKWEELSNGTTKVVK